MGLKINGSIDGSIEVDVPASCGSDLSVTLPATAGEIVVANTSGDVDLGGLTVSGSAADDSVNIDSSGRLLVGTSTSQGINSGLQVVGDTGATIHRGNATAGNAPQLRFTRSRNTTYGSFTSVADGDELGKIAFAADDGTDYSTQAATIVAFVDGTPGSNDMPGRLAFFTTADGANSPTEAMRITKDGKVHIGDGLGSAGGEAFQVIRTGGGQGTNDCLAYFETDQIDWIQKLYYNSSGSAYFMDLQQQGTRRGRVFYDGTMNYTDGSDYRLKENIVPLANGIDRVKQLQPRTYNFIEHGPEKVYDGFIAHELAEVCPYAVKGEKDAVNEDGTPDIQMIDRSHVIPLLAAGLKEAIAKIETLEAKVAALEANP